MQNERKRSVNRILKPGVGRPESWAWKIIQNE